MSDEMIERVALAMATVIAKRHGHQPEDWLTDERREEARAAIEATTVKGDGLVERLDAFQVDARRAVNGDDTPDSFLSTNWQDKPHRVVFDACALMREAADTITTLKGEIERRDEALKRIVEEDTRTERTPHLDYANDREVWTERKVLGPCAKIARQALSQGI